MIGCRRGFLVLLGLLSVQGFGESTETVRITHRFDWRRSVDKTYQGLVYGYLSGSWKITANPDGWSDVEVRYYQASESKRNNLLMEKAVEAERSARFRIDPTGRMTAFLGDGVPLYRNFPGPLPADAGPGTTWTGSGELVGDFLGTGSTTRIPLLVEYRWEGDGNYLGTPVIQVSTRYAVRYRAGQDATADSTLIGAEGTRRGMVSYRLTDRKVVFLRETASEDYRSATGSTVHNEGILLTYFEGVPALGTSSLVESFREVLLGKKPAGPPPAGESAGKPLVAAPAEPTTLPPPQTPPQTREAPQPGVVEDVRIEADPRGLKLTLDNLKFVADQAVLLPGENARLAAIVGLLKTVPGRTLLVVGHTAAVGTQASQDQLSVERALAIVQKLKEAGIPASGLLYEGRGGREPVAPNDTEANRARNRRVEIIVLDQ